MKGFSLIELLIVLSVTCLLALISYPGYERHITHVRRSDGQTALLELAQRMEQYYYHHHTYQTATIAIVWPHHHAASPWYQLSISNRTTNTYTLQATPIGIQAMNDDQCQSLTLTQSGKENITSGPKGDPMGTVEGCW